MGMSQKTVSDCGKIAVCGGVHEKQGTSVRSEAWRRKERGENTHKQRGQVGHELVQSITVISECILLGLVIPRRKETPCLKRVV